MAVRSKLRRALGSLGISADAEASAANAELEMLRDCFWAKAAPVETSTRRAKTRIGCIGLSGGVRRYRKSNITRRSLFGHEQRPPRLYRRNETCLTVLTPDNSG